MKRVKRIKPRNWLAVNAHFRKSHTQENKKDEVRNKKYKKNYDRENDE